VRVRAQIIDELSEIDHPTDLHLWRIGPEHLGAILSIATARARGPEHYRWLLGRFSRSVARDGPGAAGAGLGKTRMILVAKN
jgi:hypothetical protein